MPRNRVGTGRDRWRYECPQCGSVQQTRIYDKRKAAQMDGRGSLSEKVSKITHEYTYYCNECHSHHSKLIDKKTDCLTCP